MSLIRSISSRKYLRARISGVDGSLLRPRTTYRASHARCAQIIRTLRSTLPLLTRRSETHFDSSLRQNEQYISTSAYATKWYITLFSNSVPFATQVRLWDGLLLEGVDFLIVTALAIIWQFQGELAFFPSFNELCSH